MAKKSFSNGFHPNRTLVTMGAVTVFLMGMLLGGMASLTLFPQDAPDGALQAEQPQTPPQPGDGQEAAQPVDSERAPTVLRTTSVEWISAFKACGHECVDSDAQSAVGMTLEELKSTYADYDVRMFSTEKVKLKRELEWYCPNHYVVMLERGKVCIKKTDPETYAPYTVMELPISASVLGEDLQAALENGIPFDSLEQIDAYYESMDS